MNITFKNLSTLVEQQYKSMLDNVNGTPVRAEIPNDKLWDLYLGSFPEGSNPMFRERTRHDCNCCKNFIRRVGNLLILDGDKVTSIWDVEVGGHYQAVVDALSKIVKESRVIEYYATSESIAGSLSNNDTINPAIKWDHFYAKVPNKFVIKSCDLSSHLSEGRTDHSMLTRALSALTLDATQTVKELIMQNSIYNGQQHLDVVVAFEKVQMEYVGIPQDQKEMYVWQKAAKIGRLSRLKNTVIGTLLSDISSGVELDKAVKSFEVKVAPTNYKRTTSIATPTMIKIAQKTICDLGYEDSLYRRSATIADISVSEILFSSVHEKPLNVFDDLISTASKKPKNFDKVEEISIEDFIKNVVPNANKIEALVESRLSSNLMTLITAEHSSAKNMLKWDNPVSWSYNGNVTDAIKERVKNAGGDVDGDFVCSLAWHSGCDLDISVVCPNNNKIYFANRNTVSGGVLLDIDMNAGHAANSKDPVENIIFKNKSKIDKGRYTFTVHNFSQRSHDNGGFSIRVDNMGDVKTFSTSKHFRNHQHAEVLIVDFDGKEFKIVKTWNEFDSVNNIKQSIWGITTGEYLPVTMIMNSPNHWNKSSGHKHTFFIIDGCTPSELVRGFYTEFLNEELNANRKALELIGNKLMVTPSEGSLSGVGFSDTVRNSMIVRVTGKTKRDLKINF